MATLFSNCLPNTLDTTVYKYVPSSANATDPSAPDTFIITGDISAMWLRDSTNQVWPYLRFVNADPVLRDVVQGVIGRQARSVLIDTYANAFQENEYQGQGPHADDSTSRTAFAGTSIDAMTPSIFERKYELNSLMNTLRLASAFFNATSGAALAPFGAQWQAAVGAILDTVQDQMLDTMQEDDNGGPVYSFSRTTDEPSDSLEHGRGAPCRYTGMVKSAFRASDDATVLPFNIPENAFAVVALTEVQAVLRAVGRSDLAARAASLAATISAGIQQHGTYMHPVTGERIYAYEVDGFGNFWFQDDANIPSLLAMPYFGFCAADDPLYLATRRAVLSTVNPYFITGSVASGVGGQHNGWYWIWPMSLTAQAWTSTNDTEIASLLDTLTASSACTGLMHESFDHDDFGTFTRPWFAWANSFYADLLLELAATKPYLIFKE